VLAELSFFFCQLCAKELSLAVIEEMERMAPVLLCKLEKTFTSGLLVLFNGEMSKGSSN
jgi:hypothetical protein